MKKYIILFVCLMSCIIASATEESDTPFAQEDTTVITNPGSNVASNTGGFKSSGDKDSENTYRKVGILLTASILIIFCLISILFVYVNKLRKKVRNFNTNNVQSSKKTEELNVDKIKQSVLSKIKSEELTQRISNDDIYSVVNRSDIQLYIQTIIAGKVDEYLRINRVSDSMPANDGGSNQQSFAVQSELRTTKVEYRADNNCFVISENSQNKIFEIYSINGEYYYTIVNDFSIRKEMLGFITAFSGYVETRLVSPIPSTVEVIRDGRLIKNGDMYIVDTNCMLQVSLT